MHEDQFDLQRFLAAQESDFETAIAELRGGRKQSHWMWFIFPQLRGLGRSSMAQFYGIASLDEARATWLIRSWGHDSIWPRERCSPQRGVR